MGCHCIMPRFYVAHSFYVTSTSITMIFSFFACLIRADLESWSSRSARMFMLLRLMAMGFQGDVGGQLGRTMGRLWWWTEVQKQAVGWRWWGLVVTMRRGENGRVAASAVSSCGPRWWYPCGPPWRVQNQRPGGPAARGTGTAC